jgi:hypothetical protein
MRTMYVAVVEVATRHEVDLDEAMRQLADYRPAIGTSPRGWAEVQMSFMATGLAHACTKAAAVARAATGAESIACTVMTEHEYIARRGLEPGHDAGGRHAAYGERQMALPRQTTASDAT